MSANQDYLGIIRNPIRDIPDLVVQVKDELERINKKPKVVKKKQKKLYRMKDGYGQYYKL